MRTTVIFAPIGSVSTGGSLIEGPGNANVLIAVILWVGAAAGCGGGELGDGVPGGLAEAAGAAVGGALPGARQPGDDGGAAAADDQGEPGG